MGTRILPDNRRSPVGAASTAEMGQDIRDVPASGLEPEQTAPKTVGLPITLRRTILRIPSAQRIRHLTIPRPSRAGYREELPPTPVRTRPGRRAGGWGRGGAGHRAPPAPRPRSGPD